MMRKAKKNRNFIIPMVMGGLLMAAPHFSLANTTSAEALTCKIALSKTEEPKVEEMDLDALLREVGISEEAIATSSDLKIPVSAPVEAKPAQSGETQSADANQSAPRETFAQAFHANVDIATKISYTETDVKKAEKVMGIDRTKEPEGLAGRQAKFVEELVSMYNEMDAGAFEAKKSEIQNQLRKHNVTANGRLLESKIFDGSLGEIDRAKQVHDIQTDYKKGLKEYMVEVTKASQKVNIKVGVMQKILSKIPLIGGKTESELYDEAINDFFTEMVPIRTAIEGALGNVAEKEAKANDMVAELKKLRIVLTQLKSEYETRITELVLLQNAIIDYIETDPVLSQDPKNSLRRYLTVEVVRDLQKTIARLQDALGTVTRGIASNYNNTEDLKDAMVDLHHTSQSLKTTLAITTMDTVVQNAVADLTNLNTEMNQLILNMQDKNANQALANGRKTRENAEKMQNYVLTHIAKINETIETNQVEREKFKRASIESSRKFIEGMKTHQAVIDELISHLEKAEAASIGASYDPKDDAEYMKKLNLLIAVLNKDRNSLSGDLLDKAQAVMDKGMTAMGVHRENIWKQTEAELKKQQDALKNN